MADEKDPLGMSWKIAGGFLAAIIIAAVVFLVIWPGSSAEPEGQGGGTSAGPEQTQAQSGSPSPAPKESEDAQDSEASAQCDLGDASSDFPATTPDFEWEEHPTGVTLPVSEEHGPVVRDDDFWHCTSQTPAGAAFAGVSLVTSFGSGANAAAFDSPDARELASGLEEMMQGDGSGEATILHRGFRVINSDEDSATVEYWFEVADEGMDMSMRLPLGWDEDAQDWRLDFAAGETTAGPVEDPSQFTAWSD